MSEDTEVLTPEPPAPEAPAPAAPAKSAAWKPLAIVAAVVVVVVAVAMLAGGHGSTKSIDGTWRDTDAGAVWTFAKGTLQTTEDNDLCNGKYITSAGTTVVTAQCGDHSASFQNDTLAVAPSKDVAVLFDLDHQSTCLFRVGSAAAKLASSALEAQCSDLVTRADPDGATRSDLKNALFAEKTLYTDSQTYTASGTDLKAVEPSLDWGGKIQVVVGNTSEGSSDMVCVAEKSPFGTTYSVADVSAGPKAGTYFGKVACPAATEANFAGLGTSW